MIRFLDIRRHPDSEYHRESENRHLYLSLFFPIVLVVLIWIVKLFEMGSGIDLSWLGVFPRKLSGLIGILTAPLIHDDVRHAFSNSAPFLVLGFLLYNAYRKVALQTLLFIWLFSGIGIWLVARPAFHIGASGLVFGINFFLFFSGLFRLDMRSLALSLLVAFAYGGMVWGIFPIDMKVSFEAHAFGAAAGILAAWYFRNVDRAPEIRWEEDEVEENKQVQLPLDLPQPYPQPSPQPSPQPGPYPQVQPQPPGPGPLSITYIYTERNKEANNEADHSAG